MNPIEELKIAYRVLNPALDKLLQEVGRLPGGDLIVRRWRQRKEELEAYYEERIEGPIHF